MGKLQKIRQKLLTSVYSQLYRDTDQNLENTFLLVGVGRSGTTWLGEIINYKQDYREIFEPFLPTKVKQASSFAYYQYLTPSGRHDQQHGQAEAILTGNVRDAWTDQNLRRLLYKKRIVKEIRANLMLAWLQNNFPKVPIVYLMRHPFAVAHSWHKLGWGKPYGGQKTILDSICEQVSFQADFPQLVHRVQHLGYEDSFELAVHAWCILNYVPMRQLKPEGVHYCFYEDFLLRPEKSLGALLGFLKLPFAYETYQKILEKPSRTNFNQRGDFQAKESLLRDWQNKLTEKQMARGRHLLEAYGMQAIYQEPTQPQWGMPGLLEDMI